MKWALQIQVNLRLNSEFVDFFSNQNWVQEVYHFAPAWDGEMYSELENLGNKHLG